jgi:hypothetical protein
MNLTVRPATRRRSAAPPPTLEAEEGVRTGLSLLSPSRLSVVLLGVLLIVGAHLMIPLVPFQSYNVDDG